MKRGVPTEAKPKPESDERRLRQPCVGLCPCDVAIARIVQPFGDEGLQQIKIVSGLAAPFEKGVHRDPSMVERIFGNQQKTYASVTKLMTSFTPQIVRLNRTGTRPRVVLTPCGNGVLERIAVIYPESTDTALLMKSYYLQLDEGFHPKLIKADQLRSWGISIAGDER